MNKGICFNKISIFRQHCTGQPGQCWFISCMFFIIFHGQKKIILQDKEYNRVISDQIKKGIYFNICKSAYSSLPNRRVDRNKRIGRKDEPFLISVVPVISAVVGKMSHS